MNTIRVLDFTKFPGPRYKKYGANSGEEFRDSVLLPALQSDHELVVILDGVRGFGSSFLEEAFGGLISRCNLSRSDVDFLMSNIVSKDDPTLAEEIRDYMQEALSKQNTDLTKQPTPTHL